MIQINTPFASTSLFIAIQLIFSILERYCLYYFVFYPKSTNMKLLIKLAFGGILYCIFLSPITLFSQQIDIIFNEGGPMPEWIINDEPTYQQMKQVFLDYYGKDPKGWPGFIQEAIRLDKLFQEYNAAKGSSEHCYYHSFLKETDTDLTVNIRSPLSYKGYHQTSLRNYYAIFSYCYPEVGPEELIKERKSNEWQRLLAEELNSSSINSHWKTYANASKSEGILPIVLFQFASHCPTGMLHWCFQEVFPALDHIFKQSDLEVKFKIIESVTAHIEKLYSNKDYIKAQVWNTSFYNFMFYYEYRIKSDLPKYLNPYKFKSIISDLSQAYRETNPLSFEQYYNNILAQDLSAVSFTVPCKVNHGGELTTTTARLGFEQSDYGTIDMIVSAINTTGNRFVDHYNNRFDRDLKYSFASVWPMKNAIFDQRIGAIHYFNGFWENYEGKVYEDRIILYGFKEPAPSRRLVNDAISGIEFPKPFPKGELTGFYVTEWGNVAITYPEDLDEILHDIMRKTYVKCIDEFLGSRIIIPQIHGMDYDIPIVYEQALEVSSAPREVKPDGKSEVNIIATLYEYNSNEPESSKPLAGKVIYFDINPYEGVERGTLSAKTAVTNAHGIAKITYTAPEAEILKELPFAGQTGTTVKVKSHDYNVEDLAYINFIGEQATVFAHPSPGIGSHICIIPPDKRFPALIEVNLEGEAQREYSNKEITFTITGDNPLGVLKNDEGVESTSISVKVDAEGYAKAQYFYTSNEIPQKPLEEIIEISTKTSASPFIAIVKIGLNIIFNSSENMYEGQNVSAGEMIPLKLTLKDAWYPNLDLSQILNYWGNGGDNGNTRLFARLQIEKLGTMPKYLLDQLQIGEDPPEIFEELMSVETFRNEDRTIKEFNILWMPDGTLYGYGGMPRVKPNTAGTHYYEARITLSDFEGKDIFPRNHPASSTFLTMNTGIEADVLKVFINSNPFGPNTTEAKVLRTALSVKYGPVVSIVDAFDAINRGDVNGLYGLLFSEAKGAILDKVGNLNLVTEGATEAYSQISLAEQVYYDILNDETGSLATLDKAIFDQLSNAFNNESTKMVILTGDGKQSLCIGKGKKDKEDTEVQVSKNVTFKIGGINKETKDSFNKLKSVISKDVKCITVKEGRLFFDEKTECYSYKMAGLSIYIIPSDASTHPKDHEEIKIH